MNLPAHHDLERLVLGYMLMEPSRLDALRGVLEPSDFSLDRHQAIWAIICGLYDANKAVDRITVWESSKAAGKEHTIGHLGYLLELDNGLPENVSISGYVERLQEASLRRRMMAAAHHLELLAADEGSPVDVALEGFSASALDLARGTNDQKRATSTREMIEGEGVEGLLRPRMHRGIRLPWDRLNEALSGLGGGQMVVLMAATSRGKTSMALQMATTAALAGHAPVIWTMEMSPKSLFQRMVTQISGSPSLRRQCSFEEREGHRMAIGQLNDYPVYFDRHSRTVGSFVGSLRQVRSKTKLGLAVVDYLQLIRGSGARSNRAQEVSDNSRALKLASMDMDIPFIVLCQVDRSSVKSGGQIGLHSGKESGDIENDADVVMWIEAGELSREADTFAAVHLGKQREGPAGFSIPMVFSPVSQTFQEVI